MVLGTVLGEGVGEGECLGTRAGVKGTVLEVQGRALLERDPLLGGLV